MLFVTGDTHRMLGLIRLKKFCYEQRLTKNDYILIAGDCGVVWSKKTLEADIKEYEKLSCSILFIDGNHENFSILNEYPIEIWNKGKTHKISDSIRHLMRGQVFEIDGKKIFTLGGAESIDRIYRTKNVDWWAEEIPTYADLDEADFNLQRVNYQVDFIITHTCDYKSIFELNLTNLKKINDPTIQYLSYYEDKVQYEHWYFGHFHIDKIIHKKKTALYEEIISLML